MVLDYKDNDHLVEYTLLSLLIVATCRFPGENILDSGKYGWLDNNDPLSFRASPETFLLKENNLVLLFETVLSQMTDNALIAMSLNITKRST